MPGMYGKVRGLRGQVIGVLGMLPDDGIELEFGLTLGLQAKMGVVGGPWRRR